MEGSLFLISGRRTFSGWAVAVLVVLLVSGSRNVAAETVRISGTGGAMETMRILGEAFMKNNPGIRVEMLPGMGSSGSIKAVLAGRLDIGLSGRTLNDEEREQGAVETRYAKTPFVFAVNRTLKITGMTLEGVAGIYAGKRDWEGGKRIRLVLRSPEDTDVSVLKGMSPAMSAAVDIAVRRKGMIIATTDDDAANIIESVPGAFGGTTLSLVLSEKRALRVLALDGVVPSVRTMADRSYPYSKTFFMVTRKNPSAAVLRFIDFVRSPAGSAILSKYGQAAVRWDGGLP
ncbi:MAG TPA: substrate-binding domain-containing protein [Desulfobacteria bacterium]|nr:substrate-binding domain-containing protein [Desulfobacteria bacterium]